jgi:uncharacterized protein involved in exopolysaccharide biosynthesis
MNHWPHYLPTIPEFRAAVVRHGWKGGVLAVGLLTVFALATFSLPREYVSEAKLFVRLGHESITLDPTVTTNQTVSIYETRESEFNSLLEILKSRAVLTGVVHLLGTEAILHGAAIPELAAPVSLEPSTAPLPTTVPHDAHTEAAIAKLEKIIHVWNPKRTNIIALGAKAQSPELAQAVLNALLLVYRDVHADVNRTPGSFAFFQQQQTLLKARWEMAAHDLQQAKDRLGIASLEGKRSAQQNQLNEIEQQLQNAQVEMATSQGRVAALQKQLALIPRMAETSQLNSVSDGARTALFNLQARQQELLTKYTPAHPLVQMVNEQMAALTTESTPEHAQTTLSLNPAWQLLERNLHTEQTQLAALEAKMAGLKERQTELQQTLANYNLAEIEISALQQTVDLAAQAQREAATRLEQARLQKELVEDRVSNLNLVQPASFVSKAVGPKRTVLLMLSAFVACFTGTLFVLLHAFWNRHFTSIQAVVELLELPIIAPRHVPMVTRQPVETFAH